MYNQVRSSMRARAEAALCRVDDPLHSLSLLHKIDQACAGPIDHPSIYSSAVTTMWPVGGPDGDSNQPDPCLLEFNEPGRPHRPGRF